MKILEERILKDGKALDNNILKVDSFLNHQVDPKLMKDIGYEFANYFKNKNVTKVVTIEEFWYCTCTYGSRYFKCSFSYFKKANF